MNRYTVSISFFLSLALLLLAGCSDESLLVSGDQMTPLEEVPALAKKNEPKAVPLKGTWINTASPPTPPEETPAGCEAYFMTSQVGRATHLGKFTGRGSTCAVNIRIVEDPPFNFTGGAPPFFVADFTAAQTWTAANGDRLFIANSSGGVFVQSLVDGTSSIQAALIFNGGSGRFEGATGQAHVLGTGDINVDRLQFDGLIRYDASRPSMR